MTSAPTNIVGFRKSADTPFDGTISRYMDATQVLMCQLMDEVIRDLLGSVSHYHIPESSTCEEFYSWLDNAGSAALEQNLKMFSSVLAALGMGDTPDNMDEQLGVLRDSIKGVLRAAFDPVCTAGSPLSKPAVMKRLKELQGVLCAAKTEGAGGGPWPKFETDPLTGAQTIVTKDGTRVGINLDNSADNTNNLANMTQDNGSSGKLDPNVLAALLLARNEPPPPVVYAPGVEGAVVEPAPVPADVDTTLITAPYAPVPTAAPVSTILGLGPVGSVSVLAMIVVAVVCIWLFRKSPKAPGGGVSAPRNVPLGFAASTVPA
jgi:hypothetical protein